LSTRGELLNCDLVMKGGVTSGVVYPKAIVRVAQRYRIRSIGGTSVGALAAALTAAAEYWRQSNPDSARLQGANIDSVVDAMSASGWKSENTAVASAETALMTPDDGGHVRGFASIYQIPNEIGENLLAKFEPTFFTRGLLKYIVSIISASNAGGKVLAAVWRQFYLTRILTGILFGLIALALLQKSELAFWFAGASFVLVIFFMLLSIAPRKFLGKNTAPFIIIPGIAALLIAIYGVEELIRRSLGWGNTIDWVVELVRNNPRWIPPFALVLAVIVLWKWIEPLILRRFEGETRRRVDLALTISATIAAALGAVFIVYQTWPWLNLNRASVGFTGVGFSIGWIAGGPIALLVYLGFCVPRNFNGMCTGLGNKVSLTNWLTDKIDQVAGLDPTLGHHLTVNDLKNYQIEFEAISSDLTRGVPIDVPRALANYQFRPQDFSAFFPASVVRQLGVEESELSSDTPRSFPDWREIPIVIAARMSLSFPVLLSAVPVYYAGGNHSGNQPKRNWLSDGGIVSNFPLHKFDRSLPPWPTFALDLVDRDTDTPPEIEKQFFLNPIVPPQNDVLYSQSSQQSVLESQSEIKTADLIGFAARILSTARGWMDNSQKTLPGYAERIVQIYMYRGEGGLNLQMESKTIRRLADRGMCGLHHLLLTWESGAAGSPNQWDQHRWLRYKILMRELEQIGREWKWLYAPESETLDLSRTTANLVSDDPQFDQFRSGLAFSWQTAISADQGRKLSKLFDEFSNIAGDGVTMNAETPASAKLGPSVFDQQYKPNIHPKRFSIPPFE